MILERAGLSPPYAFLDPHGGEGDLKRSASRSALVVAQIDACGRVFVLDAWAGRVPTTAIMARMDMVIERWGVKVLGVEKTGLAGLFADAMRVNAALRMKRMPIKKVEQPRAMEKTYRIRTILQPLISRGMLFLQENQVELKNEIISFPRSIHLDLVDSLASLVRHVIPPIQTRQESAVRSDSYLKYLRDTGAHPRDIERMTRQRHGVG